MPKHAVEQQKTASAFYAGLDVDVSYYPAIWHTYKVGQLLTTDLDRVCRRHGLSMADVHLLGAVRVDAARMLRATDLAQALYVSNAALSTRVSKLEKKGLLIRIPSATDRRAYELKLSANGVAAIDAAIDDVGRSANFIRCYRHLSAQDQDALARIMGELHNQLERDVVSKSR